MFFVIDILWLLMWFWIVLFWERCVLVCYVEICFLLELMIEVCFSYISWFLLVDILLLLFMFWILNKYFLGNFEDWNCKNGGSEDFLME